MLGYDLCTDEFDAVLVKKPSDLLSVREVNFP